MLIRAENPEFYTLALFPADLAELRRKFFHTKLTKIYVEDHEENLELRVLNSKFSLAKIAEV